MKLRLSSEEVCFRLSASEYQQLCQKRKIEEEISFPDGKEMLFSLVVDEKEDCSLCSKESGATLTINEMLLEKLGSPAHAKDGVYRSLKLKEGATLRCVVQIDLGKGTRKG